MASGRMDVLEIACDWICRIAIVAIIVLIASEIFCRALLGFSMQLSDELGGYALVTVAFMSPAVCNTRGGFHRVDFIRGRLSPRGRVRLDLVMQALCLGFSLLLVWQLVRLDITSWQRDDYADTVIGTPLWLPRLPMALGSIALSVSLLQSLREGMRFLRASRP